MTVTLSSAITIMIVMIVINFIMDGFLEGIFKKDGYWYKSTLKKTWQQLSGIFFFLAVSYFSTR